MEVCEGALHRPETGPAHATRWSHTASHRPLPGPRPTLPEPWLRPAMRARVHELLADGGPREGVLTYLDEAATRGLTLAVASSSPATWVRGHLDRLGHTAQFTSVETGDRHAAKPRPDTYLAALRALAVPAAEALAFEDSPNGVAAAKAAALTIVAAPNPITATLDFGAADLVLPSFDAASLGELLARFG
ncbi:HAD-IA family hydrolase [Amycolatopsis sulphurea]|uniref:HAD-IA family hydrolase n=1 Tax=Amycolatopsis sulphurea TaxID=76022 RepID=UPI0031830E67